MNDILGNLKNGYLLACERLPRKLMVRHTHNTT